MTPDAPRVQGDQSPSLGSDAGCNQGIAVLKSRILIGICSCHKYAVKRAAVRETWLNRLPAGLSAVFFAGNEVGGSKEKDLIALQTPDDYDSLPKKVQMFFRYALEQHEFEYLFKCDDDTYVFCERLADLLKDGAEFVGSTCYWPSHADGGAGYLLSRRAVTIAAEADCPGSGQEDVWLTRTLRQAQIEFLGSPQLTQDYHAAPTAAARLITTHRCSPDILRKVHQWPAGVEQVTGAIFCYAHHKTWHGPLHLLANGFFTGGASNPNGRWQFSDNGNLLILDWFDWPTDKLHKHDFGYLSSDLRIEVLDSERMAKQ